MPDITRCPRGPATARRSTGDLRLIAARWLTPEARDHREDIDAIQLRFAIERAQWTLERWLESEARLREAVIAGLPVRRDGVGTSAAKGHPEFDPNQPRNQLGRWNRVGEDQPLRDRDAEADRFRDLLIRAGITREEAALLSRLYHILKNLPNTLEALSEFVDELDPTDLPAVVRTAIDPPKPIDELRPRVPPRGYANYSDLRSYLGSAGPGYQWHHIVPQYQTDPWMTTPHARRTIINHTDNIVRVPAVKHLMITAYLNSETRLGSGVLRRDAMAKLPHEWQNEVGVCLLQMFGVVE